ncbi:MAG TPA: META domain-containing protein [Gemmatimonadales bacterium]
MDRLARASAWVLALGANGVACATPPALPLAMTGPEWHLDSIIATDGIIHAGDSPSPATVRFLFDLERNDRGMVDGSGACNRYNGQYRALGGQGLTISVLQRTLVACSDARGELEFAFLSRLQAVDSYALEADALLLGTTTGDQLRFHSPSAPSP